MPYLFNIIYKTTISAVAIIEITSTAGLLIGAVIASKIRLSTNLYSKLTSVVALQLPVFVILPFVISINNAFINSALVCVVLFSTLFFYLGITVATVNVNINVILQTETQKQYLGRVGSLKSLGSMISMSIGLLSGGIIIENISVVAAYYNNAILFALLLLFMIKMFGLSRPMEKCK